MPYKDPEIRKQKAAEAARRRRNNPAYVEKVKEYQRTYYKNVLSKDEAQIEKARKRALGQYARDTATDVLRAERNAKTRVHSRNYYRRKAEERATRPCPDLCECCGQPDKTGRRLAWDHDHKTGIFRGWLCGSCNNALGRVGDSIDLLLGMVAYLKRTTI